MANKQSAHGAEEIIAKLRSQPTISVVEAGELFGLSRNGSYNAAKSDKFGVPTFWVGGILRVSSQSVLERLGLAAPVTPAIEGSPAAQEIVRIAETRAVEIIRAADAERANMRERAANSRMRLLRLAKRMLAEAQSLVAEIEAESIAALAGALPPRKRRGYRAPTGKPLIRETKCSLSMAEIIARFDDGQSMAKIGKEAGVTRERIRQLLGLHKAQGAQEPMN